MLYKESVKNSSQIYENLDRKEERKKQEVMEWESTKCAGLRVNTDIQKDRRKCREGLK